MSHTEDLATIWDSLIAPEKLKAIKEAGHIHTLLLHPLVIENRKILGVLVIALNRAYDNLSQFEQESIHSFVNVIATALDKALLYQQLQVLNSQLTNANAELKKLDKAKSEFISLASHQLRAPLTVIKGYVSLVSEGSFGTVTLKTQEALAKVFFSTQQLVKLVNDLLDLSRMEAGKIHYDIKPTVLAQLIERTVQEFQQNAVQKNITLAFENHAPQALPLSIDPDKISQVITNLVDNALKYSPAQGSVAVSLEQIGNQALQMRVRDSGMGIKAEDIARLFTKFVRTEEARKMDPNGSGIGLYFAKNVVEDHHGKLWVESDGVGKGSTFIVELPIG